MGARRDRGLAISRYISSETGIPFMGFENRANVITSPRPYLFQLVTDRANEALPRAMKELPRTGVPIAVRHNLFVSDSITDAWFVMRGSDFMPLLKMHYEANADRVRAFTEGR